MGSHLAFEIGSYREARSRGGGRMWVHGARCGRQPSHRLAPFWYVSVAIRRVWDRRGVVADVQPVLIGPASRHYFYDPHDGVELAAYAVPGEATADLFGVECGALERLEIDRQGDPRFDLAMRRAEAGAPISDVAMVLETAFSYRPPVAREQGVSDAALHLMRRRRGRASVEELSSELACSSRHLRRSVTSAIGIAPKSYARILRLNSALRLMDRTAAPRWADIAVRAGYADQAHMIRDFQGLAGASPAAVKMERRAESDLFNQGRVRAT